MAFIKYNPNPNTAQVGDCSVRAVSKALNQTWERSFTGLALQGFMMCNMPSANVVWGAYLHHHGFIRKSLPETCPFCYTLNDFCKDHDTGTYVVALPNHVVCVIDGDFYDTWDSSHETPIYYWKGETSYGME